MRSLLALILVAVSSVCAAESISYEIYELKGNTLIAKGTKQYSPSDVEVRSYERDGQKAAEKLIELEKGFKVGARIFYETKLTGFGLLAKRTPKDFSWEWYDQESGPRFRKLLGGTRVTVKLSGLPAVEELAEVNFNDDTRLSFIADRKGEEDTHTILVKAGSVLRLK